MISSTIPELVEMSILMVGEMLAMFPSSKVSGVGMGFLNQSTFPWMKSLISTKTGQTVTQVLQGGRTSDGACRPTGIPEWLRLQVSPHHCVSDKETGLMDCH